MNQLNYTTSNTFKQLDFTKRIIIETLLNEGRSISYIAEKINVHRSTVYREIKRGKVDLLDYELNYISKYEAKTAQSFSDSRNLNSRKKYKYLGHEDVLKDIAAKVSELKYSFEIIAGRRKLMRSPISFSFKTLYNYYHKGLLEISNGALPIYNTRKTAKATRKANLSPKSIDLRPEVINSRTEAMHWEIDTMIGRREKGAVLLVLSERTARIEIIRKLASRSSDEVIKCLDDLEIKFEGKFSEFIKSLTSDRGSEFLNHLGIEQSVLDPNKKRTVQYFCNPYCSSERGTNENLNREIRRFFPKKTKLDNLTTEDILKVQNWMNNKPRKVLGFLTPNEYMSKINPEFLKLLSA